MSFARYIAPTRAEKLRARTKRNAAVARSVAAGPKRGAVVGGSLAGAAEKTEAKRNRTLLDMAKGRPCLLCIPGQCVCRPGSVVACHSNLPQHGKGKSRKADDCYSVWGGDFAHQWLDRSDATRAAKEAAFMAAHLRQVQEWRVVAADPSEPERFRKAAQWALDQLGATPLGEPA